VINNSASSISSSIGQTAITMVGNSTNQMWLGFWNANQLVVGINNDEQLMPEKFELLQNFRNPFNPSTKIKYSIPELSNVRLEIFNILGERITILIDQEQKPGYYVIDFNAENLSSGFYIYRIQAKDFVEVKKMVLLK